MNTLKLLLIALAFVNLISCNKDEQIEINENDYLIFGHFYGECLGEECVENFKLTDTKLFEDINDSYAGHIPFDFLELGNDKYIKVNDLASFFPPDLLKETMETFGCPDCADQGGIYIEYKKNEDIHKWKIDQAKDQVPTYLHEFMDKVNEKIALINN